MDPTLLTKTVSAGALTVAVMVLALTGKVDGPVALGAIQWIGVTFLGGAAVLGATAAIAAALAPPKPPIAPPVAAAVVIRDKPDPITPIGLVLAVLTFGYWQSACTPAHTAKEDQDVAAYSAEQNACVADGSTGGEIDNCRAASRARWCGRYPDAINCKGGP